ncbi:MAG: flippase [Patescibacteria group bacterium]|jgi:O-antigen/teichoic acid export membrane protein
MQNLTKSIASNTFWQILGKIVGTIIGLATIGLLTRYLGSEGFGYYTMALAFMQFFGVLVDLGLYLICLKEMAANPQNEQKIFNNIFTLRIISAIILLGGGCLLIFAFPYPTQVKWAAVIVSLSFFFASLVQTLTTVFQKYLKMGLVALAEVLGRLVFFLATIWFIFYQADLITLMWGNVLNTLVYFLILWILIKKYIKITWAFDFSYWKIILQKTWPIALGIAFNLVYFRADTIILSLFKPALDVGIYGAPYKILEIITTFPHMFMGLIMPLLTAAWISQNLERFKNVMQKTFDFFIILAVPMVLGTIPLSNKIMTLIAGPEFIASGAVLPALMLATGIIFMGILFTYCLVILDKQKNMLKYYFSAAVLALIGYFIFIPRYSYFGAAWVTVIIELFIALSAFALTYKFSRVSLSFNIFWKALLASIIMLVCLNLLINWPIIWLVLTGIIVYTLVMMAIKGINKQLLGSILK